MIFWLLIAAAILLASLVIAVRSMKTVSEVEELVVPTELPPQPRVRHQYDKDTESPGEVKPVASQPVPPLPVSAPIVPASSANMMPQPVLHHQAVQAPEPKTVEEALAHLRDAQERAKTRVNTVANAPGMPVLERIVEKNIPQTQQPVATITMGKLGRFIGSIPISTGTGK